MSFIAVFGISQTMGGLAGSAIMGTLQIYREKAHSHAIVSNINAGDPVFAQRVAAESSPYRQLGLDAASLRTQGVASLSRKATREANVLAFNDVFATVGWVAAALFLWMAGRYLQRWLSRDTAPPAPPSR